jgi:hypothetical protein
MTPEDGHNARRTLRTKYWLDLLPRNTSPSLKLTVNASSANSSSVVPVQ